MIEDELRAHYAAIAADPDADARALAAVLTPPSRRHTLRTGVAVSASVAAVAALALVIAIIPRDHGHPSDGGGSVAAASPSIASSSVVPTSTPTTTPALLPVTPQVVVQTLIDLVSSKGTATTPGGRGVDNSSLGQIVFNDGHGAAQIDIAVVWKGTAEPDQVPKPCTPSATCTVLADGTTVGTRQSLEYGAGSSHAINSTEWDVSAYRPSDGIEIDISEWNAAAPKDSPITRPEPPFTLAELTALATSPKWSATATAVTITADAGLFVPDFMLTPKNSGPVSPSTSTTK